MRPPKPRLQPGEIVLPTPVIRRARGHQLSSPLQPPPLGGIDTAVKRRRVENHMRLVKRSSVLHDLEMELHFLRNRVGSTKLSLYESLLRALNSLLTATSEISPAASANKSLMSMCLRKLPEYIDELEYWEQRDAEEQGTKSTLQNSDVSSEIYEEVVAMLPPTRNGCPQLRQLVRAHGLRLVRNAIVEGLFDIQFEIILVKLCSMKKAHSEAELLLETLLDLDVASSRKAASNARGSMYPKPRRVDSTFDEARKLAPLSALHDYAKHCERQNFMLRQLSGLIFHQKLPVDWLSTKEFIPIWSRIVRTLSGKEACDDTTSFVVHAVTALARQVRKTTYSVTSEPANSRVSLQQTLLSTITTVATLPLLQHHGTASLQHVIDQGGNLVTTQRVERIMKLCICEASKQRKSTWIMTILDLAAFFASTLRNHSSGRENIPLILIHTNNDSKDARQHREAATALICTLAQFMGRGASEASHHFLIRLLDRLDNALPGEDTMPRSLRANCAFFLAERTLDLRDLAFAESFNNESGSVEVDRKTTPGRAHVELSPNAKFRWDEGIAEWVTATPAAAIADKEAQHPRRRSLRGRRLQRSNIETCRDLGAESDDGFRIGSSANKEEEDDDYADSDDSAKHLTCKPGTKHSSGKAAVAVETHNKRKRTVSVLTYSSDDDEEEGYTEEGSYNAVRNRSRARGRQNTEQDTKQEDMHKSSGGHHEQPPVKKRRRAAGALLKPYRSILHAASHAGGSTELSEDELCL